MEDRASEDGTEDEMMIYAPVVNSDDVDCSSDTPDSSWTAHTDGIDDKQSTADSG